MGTPNPARARRRHQRTSGLLLAARAAVALPRPRSRRIRINVAGSARLPSLPRSRRLLSLRACVAGGVTPGGEGVGGIRGRGGAESAATLPDPRACSLPPVENESEVQAPEDEEASEKEWCRLRRQWRLRATGEEMPVEEGPRGRSVFYRGAYSKSSASVNGGFSEAYILK